MPLPIRTVSVWIAFILFGIGLPVHATVTAQTASVSFGSVAIGAGSSTSAISFTVSAGTTVSSVSVLTQGTAGSDFADAGGSTCTAQTYAAATTCVVNVHFIPAYPGLMTGAVVLSDATGNALATVLLSGVGTGPALAFLDGYEKIPATHLTTAVDVKVDRAQDVFILDQGTEYIYEIASANPGVRKVIGNSYVAAEGIALDGANNVYVSDAGGSAVYKITPNGVQTKLHASVSSPVGLVVDTTGNLYIADAAAGSVLKLAPSGTQTTVASGFAQPAYLALDAAGNLYVTDYNAATIYKITPAGAKSIVNNGILQPAGIAVDAAGDVYVASSATSPQSIYDISPSGTVTILLTETDQAYPKGLAIDPMGNVYIANSNAALALPSANITELYRSANPSFAFPSATSVGHIDTADGAMSVPIQNIGNTNLIFTAGKNPGYPVSFPEATSVPNLCTSSTPLTSTAICNIAADFEPNASGSITGSIILTDNALNQTNAIQTISTSGTGTNSSQTITFSAISGPVTYGVAPLSLTATASSGLAVSFSVVSGPATVSGSTLTVTGAGTIVVRASQPGNSSIPAAASVQQSFNVNKASLTVTPKSAASIYGSTLPALTYSIAGFVNGETSSVVYGVPSLTTTATASSSVGSYPIAASTGTLSAANYTFSFVNGASISIGKATLKVTASSISVVFKQTIPALTFSIAGFVNNDTAALATTGAPAESTTATSSSVVGSYPITITAGTLVAANYTFAFTNGTVTVLSGTTSATPVLSLAGGTYSTAQTVTMSDSTPGAVIYYTVNGTNPTALSTKYTGPVHVSSTETIEAIAVTAGYANSSVAVATYTIGNPATAPVFSLPGGTYTGTQRVRITTATPNATIYYTLNGTIPTTSSTRYIGRIYVSTSETIKAVAVAAGFTTSAVTSAVYVIH